MKSVVIIATIAFAAMVMYMAGPSEAVTCNQITQALSPCTTFLTGGAGPRPECCNGVQSIRTITPNKADRVQACNCLKQAAAQLPNFKPDMASQLPQKCGINFPYPISPTVDCSSCGLD